MIIIIYFGCHLHLPFWDSRFCLRCTPMELKYMKHRKGDIQAQAGSSQSLLTAQGYVVESYDLILTTALRQKPETVSAFCRKAVDKLVGFRHFRKEKEIEVEMRPALIYGIVNGEALVSYWAIFFSLSLVTVPEVFAKVNSPQIPTRFLSGECRKCIRRVRLGSAYPFSLYYN